MNATEIEDAISRLIDGRLSESEQATLQEAIDTDLNAMEVYLRTIRLHEDLTNSHSDKSATVAFSESIDTNGSDPERTSRNFLPKRTIQLAAAIVLLVSLATLLINLDHLEPEKSTAETGFSLIPSKNSRYTVVNSEPGDLKISSGSEITIEAGYAKIRFPSGVVAGLSAPAEASVSGPNSIRLREGRGFFSVPRKAVGFEVLTDELRVIDHGTEFSVLASPTGLDEAQLFKGAIEVENLSGSDKPILLKGSGMVRKNNRDGLQVFRRPLDAYKAPAFTDLRLDDTAGNLTTRTSPPLLFSNIHDDADGSWGFAWKDGRADCAQVLQNGEAWVTRMDLGENTPMLTTTLSGLEPFKKYECSILLPLRQGSGQGAVMVSFDTESPEWNLAHNENSSPTGGPEFRGYYEARHILGVQQADSNGEIRINFKKALPSTGRSYISAIGVRPDEI